MRARARTGGRAQAASLIALGAFAVHQLRYLLAYGGGSDEELARQGHDYLANAVPILVGFALAALSARFVRHLISTQTPGSERRIKATTYALGIAAVFCSQELIEGALFAGHASGLAAIFSAGGWAALPLAALFGILAALVDRGMEAIELRIAPSPPPTKRPTLRPKPPASPLQLGRRPAPLAFGLARRPPPRLA